MKVLLIHNDYGRFSGEETVVQDVECLLTIKGHKVLRFSRSSVEIGGSVTGKARALFSGVYNRSSRTSLREIIVAERPDVANVHKVFPLISPSVLPELRSCGIPTVMTVHNYRLVCPTGLHFSRGEVCERCNDGNEYWCLLKGCADGPLKSAGYAIRNYVGRKVGFFRNNITLYAPLTEFSKQRLIATGIPEERISVIPNMYHPGSLPADCSGGSVVGYVGRISQEKGIEHLLVAAKACPRLKFQIAGDYSDYRSLVENVPTNVKFLGLLDREGLDAMYANIAVLVYPSIWYEPFGLSIIEAGIRGIPVLCSRIGGIPEIVDDGVTGLLFEPGNAQELAEKVQYLCRRPELRKQMGASGREKVLREHSPDKYYERLMAAFDRAIALGPGGSK